MSQAPEHPPLVSPSASGRKSLSIVGWILLFLGIVATLYTGLEKWNEVIQDDTYISLIYSRNFARGLGLVYNPGHEAVEGYTNFSWTVLAGWAIQLGWDPVQFVQFAALACAVVVVVQTYFLARRIGVSPVFSGAAALTMGLRPALTTEAMGGLETCLFALAIQGAIFLTLSPRPRIATRLGAGLFLGLAAITRPEGVFVFGLIELSFLWLAWRESRSESGTFPKWLKAGLVRWAPFVLIVGSHLTFRWLTYNDYIPNTARAKVHSSNELYGRGFDYVFQGISYFGALFLILPYLLMNRIKGRGAGVLLFINAVYVLYIFKVGGDFKLTWRFFVVLFPIWCSLAALSFESITESMRAHSSLARAGSLGLFLLYMGAHLAWEYKNRPPKAPVAHDQLIAAGKHLNSVLPEGSWIAANMAGCIPYYTDRNTLDMMGLSDKHIARAPVREYAQKKTGHERGDGKYVLDCEPDVIIIQKAGFSAYPLNRTRDVMKEILKHPTGASEIEIFQDERFLKEYKLQTIALEGLDEVAYFNYFRRR